MKRVFSLILVSVMLLSAVFMCRLDANAAEIEKKPFYFSNWTAGDSDYPHIYDKAYIWAVRNGDEITVSYGGETTIEGIAQAMKETFDKYPEDSNMRIMNVTPLERRFMSDAAEDIVFMEEGTKAMAAWMEEFLAEYKRIGGKLDGVHSDLEYTAGYAQYLYNAFNSGKTDVYNDIINNPAYLTRVRPELEARGFKFSPKPLDSMPEALKKQFTEINCIKPNSGKENEQSRCIWDVVIKNMYSDYLTEAFYEPLIKYYPDAWFDDWETRDSYGWMKEIPTSGHTMYLGGNYIKAGDYSNYSYYNYAPFTQWVAQSDSNTTYTKPVSHNDAVYEDNAFNMTLWEVNTSKNMYAATDTKKVAITLTFYDWAYLHSNYGSEGNTNTPYHVETYFHSGLLDPLFGGYFIQNEVPNAAEFDFRIQVLSEILTELTRVAGYADRKPIETPANWNDSFILSGMYAGGRNIWRITPDTITGVSKKDFLVKADDNEVVFYNKGQTITFPKGNIIEDGFVSAVGTCGYWVETPADVSPIITNDADRYQKYPAFFEVFDNYKTGANFNLNIIKNSHTWNAWVLDNSSATIKEDPNNPKDKVLAIQGNATLNNVKVPEYITAGDNYATEQAWEVSFNLGTMPTGDAEIKMLKASSGTGINTDGGFRVYDGKLYYGKTGEYVAFENVTLATDTEYKVKRVMNFKNADALTCNYYVYDASGKLLDKAENVAVVNLSLPVQNISLSTENFSGTVYFDDYKLYAAGVTTDLEIYNADTGIMVADATAKQNTNTAYRLSWMNASDATKYYNVVATYDDGTKEILKSVEMLPGSDAVDTGIVKVNDKSVAISIEEVESDNPGSDNNSNNGDDSNSSLLLIVIAVAVACVCAIAITLVVATTSKKKPSKKAGAKKAPAKKANAPAKTKKSTKSETETE